MTPPAALALGNELVLWVILIPCVTALLIIALIDKRGHDDSDDQGSGPGGGGPEMPRSPKGPSSGEPLWWPEFERQFADYLQKIDDSSSRLPCSPPL